MEAAIKKAVRLVKQGKTKAAACKVTGASRTYLNRALEELGITPKFSWCSSEEKSRAIALYRQGVVPKEMHKHGITAQWITIYKWVQAAGCATIRFNTRGELRKKIAKADFPEEEWKAYSKLVRRLSNDTYREHRDTIDPEHKRGKDWHLDHKTSVYSAFLKRWPPERAAHRRNLQMLPERENRRKFTN